ncbi:MAG: SDR family oxidoreductase [Anaerolineae bacterium]|nr:SDR family oxidoreductase [Anaerolineae bacterium]
MAVIDLKGKVALVTGSARRVGQRIALTLAENGMDVVIHYGSDSSAEDAAKTADQARALGVRAEVIQADLRQRDEIDQLFARLDQNFGRLDVLVNSAASFDKSDITKISLEDWEATLNLNLTAPFLCSQHAVHLMREHKTGGSIINILDLSAFGVWRTFAAHSVSKVGLKALTEVLALNAAPDIRVNAIAPGPVLRDDGNSPERWEQIGKGLPLQKTGDPVDVAQAVVFLATQPFLTGVTIRVDGGEALLRYS